jgi:RNA recognition motif-containing protein
MTRIWIAKLPVDFTESSLVDFFTKNGFKNVQNAKIVYPKVAHAFVKIKTTDVDKAIKDIPKSALKKNLIIYVEKAIIQDTEPVNPSMTRIWIGYLPKTITAKDLLSIFENVGIEATEVDIVYQRKAYGFIDINDSDVHRALNDSDVHYALNDLPTIVGTNQNLKIKVEVAKKQRK